MKIKKKKRKFFFFFKLNFVKKIKKKLIFYIMEKDIIGIILTYLKTETSIPDSNEFAAINQVDHLTLVGNLKSLNSFNYVELNQLEKQKWSLTKEGLDYVANGK